MSKRCQFSGKKPVAGRSYTYRGIPKKQKGIGLKVTGKVGRRFIPNIKDKRLWIPEEKRFVTLRLSAAAMRTIDKIGISAALRKMRAAGEKI